MTKIQFQINGQNYFVKYLQRVPEKGESIFLISNSTEDMSKSVFKQFIVSQVSTVMKDPAPPEGYSSVIEDHCICSIVSPQSTKSEETKTDDQGSFDDQKLNS